MEHNYVNQITLGSLFDGIGGFPYAGSMFGIKPLWASEIMPQATSVAMRYFPEMEHFSDITKLDGSKLPPVDIITFGSPCQDLSTAGKRAGMNGERSSLFYEAIRIIDEMRIATNGKYPRYAIWENVPGALSSGNPRGSDFNSVLEAFTKTKIPMPVSGKWANAGMVRSERADIAWCLYNAQYFGVPQRRRRIFLISDFGGESAGEILFVPKGLPRNPTAGGTATQRTAADVEGSVGNTSRSGSVKDIAPTITASYGKNRDFNANAYNGSNFALSPCVVVNDQGGDSLNVEKSELSPTLRSETHGNLPIVSLPINTQIATRHKALGKGTSFGIGKDGDPAFTLQKAHSHAVAVGVHQGQSGDVNISPTAYTLTTASGASARNAPLVCENLKAFSLDGDSSNSMKSPNPLSGCREVETARTLDTSHPCPSKNQGGVAVVGIHPKVAGTLVASGSGLSRPGGMGSETDLCVAYCLQGNMVGRDDNSGPNGKGVKEETSYTLTATDNHAVAYGSTSYGGFKEGYTATLTASGGSNGGGSETLVASYIVRRLTPTECERLQGYPDDWTKFGHDGKLISDTRRYQMLGNSVATPCVAYILMGVAEQMRKGVDVDGLRSSA